MRAISLFELEQIKREAKKHKANHPEISYNQCLDLVSRTQYKFRNYHEAKILCDRQLDSFLTTKADLVTCSFCGLTFCKDLDDDVQEHYSRHLKFEKVFHVLKYTPKFYAERENDKKQAYINLRSSLPDKQREGALQLIRAHFDRSLANAIDKDWWKDHPTFEGYVGMVDVYDHLIPVDVIKAIKKDFPSKGYKMPKGDTDWRPETVLNDMHVSKKSKMRDLVSAAINYLIDRNLLALDRLDDTEGSIDTQLLGKVTKIQWAGIGFGEIRVTVWWGLKQKCIAGSTTLPLNKNLRDAIDVCCSAWIERQNGKWLQGYGSEGIFDTYCARSSEKDLQNIPDIEPVGFLKEGKLLF